MNLPFLLVSFLNQIANIVKKCICVEKEDMKHIHNCPLQPFSFIPLISFILYLTSLNRAGVAKPQLKILDKIWDKNLGQTDVQTDKQDQI